MKILIVSDTHGRERNLEKVLEKTEPIDHLIHLGDVEGSEELICTMTDAPVTMVAGNNDYYSDLPREEIITLGKYRVLLTHGHYYYVTMNEEYLKKEAKDRGADIVMYGHTHRPAYSDEDGLITLNPGSISYPRQAGREPSYMIMEIDENGVVNVQLMHV